MTSATARLTLTPQEMGPYLLRRGLTSPATIVDSDLEIIDTSRRNCNMVVATEHGPSYLLKQGLDDRTRATVGHEATVYRFLGGLPNSAPLARFLPRCHDYDHDNGVLVLELLPKAMSLREHTLRRRRCSLRLARELGKALAALHACDTAPLRADSGSFQGDRPWVLTINRPAIDAIRQASNAGIQLFTVVQRFPALGETLEDLRRTWQPAALIHGDLRWENCLIHSRRPGDRTDVKLIDFEFADLGEPGWDIGSVFAEYLTCWLRSVPVTGQFPPDRFLALASFPLARVQPAVRAFWQAYVRQAGLAPAAAATLMLRATRFCGARLFQAAFEHVSGSIELDAYAVVLMQLGQNVLERPADASLHVLGLPSFPGVA